MVEVRNIKLTFAILLVFFPLCHTSVLHSKYSRARQVRILEGHDAAQPLYQEILSLNPDDSTAATRVAAHPKTISRHLQIGNSGTIKERLTLISRLKQWNFTSNAIADHIFQNNNSDTAKSSAAPLYLKPLRAGTNPPPLPKGPLDACIQLLIMATCLPLGISRTLLGDDTIDLMQTLGIAFQDDDFLVPYCHVMPVKLLDSNLYIATDLHPNVLSTTTIRDNEGAVMYIGPDSMALMDHWISYEQHSSDCKIVDIGSGSGIQALSMAASYGDDSSLSVTSVDINPRALKLTGLNFEWNGLKRPKLILGDIRESSGLLYNNNERLTWEELLGEPTTILANPPFLPVPIKDPIISKRYGSFSSGGASGDLILERIVKLASKILSKKSGTLAIVSEFMNPLSEFPRKLEEWWDTNKSSGQAIMFVNELPIDAETYSKRRADDDSEVEQWKRHLRQEHITEISPGLLFIKTKSNSDDFQFSQYSVPKTDQGSIWTPTNLNARKFIKTILESHWPTS